MIIPEDPELAWVVGIFEGEGSFCVVRQSDNTFGLCPQAKIKMTDQDVIYQFSRIVPGWYHCTEQDHRLLKNGNLPKLCYTYRSRSVDDVKDFIDSTFPYYSEKKQRDASRVLDLIMRKQENRAK